MGHHFVSRRRRHPRRTGRPGGLGRVGVWAVTGAASAVFTAVLVGVAAGPAWAQPPQPASLETVIDNLRVWIMGIIAAVATLFLVIGGLRYITAGGDPSEIERAKGNLKSALLGYALAVLAPLLLAILQSILGI